MFMPLASQQTTQDSATRQIILQAAFDEIHAHGFQAASLAKILSTTGVTKGALYYYFPNKLTLGYAVVDELLKLQILQKWIEPLKNSDDPVKSMKQIMYQAGQDLSSEVIEYGCPLNNLAQEMAPVDEGFRSRIEALYELWRKGIEEAFKRGQDKGFIKKDINVSSVATMIIASLEGCMGLAKNAQSKKLLFQCGQSVMDYLDSLTAKGT